MSPSAEKRTDLHFGDAEEQKVFPVIKQFFNHPNLKRNPDKYGKYDFYVDIDDDTIETFELKSRNYNSFHPKLRAEGCIINTDKFETATYVLFNFTDALYFYEVCPNEVNTFKTELGYQRQREGGCAPNKVSYVPFTHLKLLQKWPSRGCLITLD